MPSGLTAVPLSIGGDRADQPHPPVVALDLDFDRHREVGAEVLVAREGEAVAVAGGAAAPVVQPNSVGGEL